MKGIPQLPQPATIPGDHDIDFRQLGSSLQRHWQLAASIAAGMLTLSSLYALLAPPIWKGEFQIVLSLPENNIGNSTSKLSSVPLASQILGVNGLSYKDSLQTEVKVLESPSVLKPVFDFVRTSKQRAGDNTDQMRFVDWVKDNVEVKLEKGTSVLNISYTDTDKALILPVIDRISREYQSYSGRDRRRNIANAIAYLKTSITELSPKADASMRRAQSYALSHGLALNDGVPQTSGPDMPSISNLGQLPTGVVESNRQQAQANMLLLQQQLRQAKSNGNRTLFQAPQLSANGNLYQQYQLIEARLSYQRSRLRDNDELVRSLRRQRASLIDTINHQTIGLLQGQLATAQAALKASSRPDEVVLKHRELVRKALRDEKTLVELENQLQLNQLEQAKQILPWELISKPTLLDSPVAPKKGLILAIGLFAGLVAGSSAALVADHLSGRVFASEELQQLLPGPLLTQLSPSEPTGFNCQLALLARGPLEDSHRVALIPVGLPPKAAPVQRLLEQLQELMPHTEIFCSTDLVQAADCEHQLLLTSLGAPTRSQLQTLRQQLLLQNRPITGWMLLHESGAA
jgi:succinoglycan biosynthesis transport protein ExoP